MIVPSDVRLMSQSLARTSGWHVFPCRADKTPATPRGFKDAARNPDIIAALWERHPAPLIGIATGAVSGVAVLDIDVKHDAAAAWWIRNEHRVPVTRTYRTRSGGLHLYFQYEPGIRCASGRPVVGVDVRGDGGYVICWFADGQECLDHMPPRPWPAWLSDAIWPPSKPLPASPRRDNAPGAVDGILRTVREAPEGERNSILFWGAHRLHERITAGAIGRGEVERDLLAAASECGLPEFEARRTIASAWRAS